MAAAKRKVLDRSSQLASLASLAGLWLILRRLDAGASMVEVVALFAVLVAGPRVWLWTQPGRPAEGEGEDAGADAPDGPRWWSPAGLEHVVVSLLIGAAALTWTPPGSVPMAILVGVQLLGLRPPVGLWRLLVLGGLIVLAARPPESEWRALEVALPRSGQLDTMMSDPQAARGGDWLVVAAGAMVETRFVVVDLQRDAPRTLRLDATGYRWALDAARDQLWVGSHKEQERELRSFALPGGEASDQARRPRGHMSHLVAVDGLLVAVVAQQLCLLGADDEGWRVVGQSSAVAAARGPDGARLLSTHLHAWRQSDDGGRTWRSVKPPGRWFEQRPVVTGDGWRYVLATDDLDRDALFVGAPGEPLTRRELPAPCVGVVAADEDGRRVWVWSNIWGVFASTDGGERWRAVGLQLRGLRAVVVDPARRRLIAAPTAPLANRRLLARPFD